MNTTQHLPTCPGFVGNNDFYGFGIRLGVYMQLVSSWIINTFSPEKAADNHDANSIFVFAITIAILKAEYEGSIRPIEAWLMLQTCLAFFLTVLSLAGVRLHFLNAKSAAKFADDMRQLILNRGTSRDLANASYYSGGGEKLGRSGIMPKRTNSSFRRVSRQLTRVFGTVSFRTVTSIKHPSLSWTGLVWRSWIATLLLAANLWYWLRYDDSESHCQWCTFFFHRAVLYGRLVIFFRVMGFFAAIPLFVLAVLGLWMCQLVVRYLLNIAIRYLIFQHLEYSNPGEWDGLNRFARRRLGRFAPGMDLKNGYVLETLRKNLLGKIWLDNRTALPTMDDLILAYAFMSSEGVEAEVMQPNASTGSNVLARSVCVFTHIIVGLSIGWFILAIELTIRWNGITNVYSLSTTGQLIPFVIGLMSFISAMQETALVMIKLKYPGWKDIDFKIAIGPFGESRFTIVKQKTDAPGGEISNPNAGKSSEDAEGTHLTAASQESKQ